jgi:solute carrier family 5 (sodium-coupled monocarboxylate transporter), member 8/12
MMALIMVMVRGAIVVGGPSKVWQDAYNSERVEFFKFVALNFYLRTRIITMFLSSIDPDPRIRHSFWTVVVGGSFYWIAMNAATQSSVQRLMTAPSNKHATWYANKFCFIYLTPK